MCNKIIHISLFVPINTMRHDKMHICDNVSKIAFNSKPYRLQKLLSENSCSQSRTIIVL